MTNMTSDKSTSLAHYPVAIIQDRYGGTYSEGKWIAIAEIDKHLNRFVQNDRDLSSGPWGDDLDAANFWLDPPRWAASGDTPEQAVANLLAKFGS